MPGAIEVDVLEKTFRGKVVAVDGLSFTVEAGQVCGLLGPNGAGKTTTIRMLMGLIHPDSGSTSIFGERIKPGSPVLGRVGALVENPAFIPHLPGIKNLELYWRAGGGKWPAPGLEAGLALAGLGDAVKRKVKTYSQGMRQRLGLAQSLLGEPDLLVLDEPTNGLDPGEMREMRRLLGDLSQHGVTTLLSSHLLAEVEQVCSHAVVMHRGSLITAGPVADLIGASSTVFLEVDDRDRAERILSGHTGVLSVTRDGNGFRLELGSATRPQLVAALVKENVGVETVMSRNRLEDTFLDLVGEEEV